MLGPPGDGLETALGRPEFFQRDLGRRGIELQSRLARIHAARVEAIERPEAGVHRKFLLFEAIPKSVAMLDARAIGDDQGSAGIGFGFLEGFDGLAVFGTKGDCAT